MYLVTGNWKLHGNKSMIITFLAELKKNLVNIITLQCDIVVAFPVMYLDIASSCVRDSCIKLCAQNVDINVFGSYTGDISAEMLKDVGVRYVIIGHSERRINHKESNLYIAKKFSVLKKSGLIPVLCIGENQEEYNDGRTYVVCIEQIDAIIQLLGVQAFKNTVIAYEPIWAIGSGISAIPINVQKIHKFIRDYIAQYDEFIAKTISIQYGGSITSDNVAQFVNQNDIDGVLVGSSALSIVNFLKIIKIVEKYKRV